MRLFLVFPLAFVLASALPAQTGTKVAPPPPPHKTTCSLRTSPLSPGDIAYTHGDYARAADLYGAEAKAPGPEGDRAHNGLVRALIRAGRVDAADAEVAAWAEAAPGNAWQHVALGEVQWREGKLTEALASFGSADPCNARAHADLARTQLLSGLLASAEKQLAFAHKLDPVDEDIATQWSQLQPRSVQLAGLTSYLEHSTSLSDEERKKLEAFKASLATPAGSSCRLTSSVQSATIPYRGIRMTPNSGYPVGNSASGIWGLDVGFDGKNRRLEIDTGASGLLLTKEAAAFLHLTPKEKTSVSDLGNRTDAGAYIANVKTLTIGPLTFEDCDVTVLSKNPVGLRAEDGLIGGDVFRNFLLTLDFPGHVMKLDPLPPLPSVAKTEPGPALATSGVPDDIVRDRYIDPSMASWEKIFQSGHDLLIPVRISNHAPRLFIVDTGDHVNAVSLTAALDAGKLHKESVNDVYGAAGKVKTVYTTSRMSLQFGSMVYPADQWSAFNMDGISRGVGTEVSGFLGTAILH